MLLRFVVGPDGTVVPDVEARLPGRGLWLTPRRDIVERALAKRMFARAARRPVVVAPQLAERIEGLLARRCGELVGLARRAGSAVAGFDKVGEAVRHARVELLLEALDGAEGGRRKIAALGRDLPAARVLTMAELGAAFGREHVVHAALGGGSLTGRLVVELSRLAGMRPAAVVSWGSAGNAPGAPAAKDFGTRAND